jgi:hypothetical protein
MAADRSFLERHGNQWRVQVKVPVKLRPIVGKPRLVEPLRTDSLAIANREKWKHVTTFKEILTRAEVELRHRANIPVDRWSRKRSNGVKS